MRHDAVKSKTRRFRGLSWLVLLLLLFLAACGSEKKPSTVYQVEEQGKVFTVDQEQQTISVDGYVCQYEVTGSGGSADLHVTYPDGSTYWWSEGGHVGYGGWSDNYDPDKYVAGEVLWDVLCLSVPTKTDDSGHYIGLGLILILLGAVHAISPHTMWYLSYGWHFKDAEPSDLALFAERAGGIVAIVAGVVCLFV